ncbi:MAG: hypothetical protein NVS2B14_14550 [Chamaesiphon sp.]
MKLTIYLKNPCEIVDIGLEDLAKFVEENRERIQFRHKKMGLRRGNPDVENSDKGHLHHEIQQPPKAHGN